jgi:hypothetical protein
MVEDGIDGADDALLWTASPDVPQAFVGKVDAGDEKIDGRSRVESQEGLVREAVVEHLLLLVR